MMPEVATRQRWASSLGAVLAVAGSAIGLGNFLRFPGLAAKFGGGVFLIPYFVALFLIGMPLCWAEWSIGRLGGRNGYNSAPGIFRVATGWKNGHYLGVLAILVPLIVYMYYVYIEAWCLAYAWYYATGQLDLGPTAEPYSGFFESLVGTGGNGSVATIDSPIALALVASIGLNLLLIYRGVTRGIESFCRLAMPVMVVCALLVLVRVLTLGTPNPDLPEQNVLNGLGFMWNPKIDDGQTLVGMLSNPEIWLQATGQVFFSIAIGFGIIISYSSYIGTDDDIVLTGLTAASTNEFCELCLGGLITIPTAFIFLGPAPIEKVAGSTFGLGFYTLPVVFHFMPLGSLIGFLWFFLLFLAAVTSSIAMLQPVLAFLEEGARLSRARGVALLAAVTTGGTALVVYYSRDMIALDAMDFWVGQVGIFILATIIAVVFAWVLGTDAGIRELRRGALMDLPPGFAFIITYVSPTYLLAIFALFLVHNGPDYVAQLANQPEAGIALTLVATMAAGLIFLVHRAGKRWNEEQSPAERAQ